MQINFNDPNPPVKVVIGKDGENNTFLMLRPASGEILEKIKKETHVRTFKNVRGAVHEFFDVDEDRYDFLLWKYCLTGWGGIRDEGGHKIDYSPQMGADLIKQSPYFSELVGDALDDVKKIIAERAKAAAKN